MTHIFLLFLLFSFAFKLTSLKFCCFVEIISHSSRFIAKKFKKADNHKYIFHAFKWIMRT